MTTCTLKKKTWLSCFEATCKCFVNILEAGQLYRNHSHRHFLTEKATHARIGGFMGAPWQQTCRKSKPSNMASCSSLTVSGCCLLILCFLCTVGYMQLVCTHQLVDILDITRSPKSMPCQRDPSVSCQTDASMSCHKDPSKSCQTDVSMNVTKIPASHAKEI